jgi:hypothetical protein
MAWEKGVQEFRSRTGTSVFIIIIHVLGLFCLENLSAPYRELLNSSRPFGVSEQMDMQAVAISVTVMFADIDQR